MNATEFPETYRAARAQFLAAAQISGAAIEHHGLAGYAGVDGEDLAIDVATLGPAGGARTVFVLSGTHGIEGFAGSIVQTQLLRRLASSAVPAGVRLVLVHAVNPFGFSFGTRNNESNVDLNRNYLLPGEPVPVNAGYPDIHGVVAVERWDDRTEARISSALASYARRHGAQALTDALIGGQYAVPTGLNYGGAGREWSIITLTDIVRRLGEGTERRVVVDLHTGIAPSGDAAILCFGTVDDPRSALEARYFHIAEDPRFHLGAPGLAKLTGLVVAGLKQECGAGTIGAVVEFGTTGREAIRMALCRDRWLRFHPPRDESAAAAARAAIRAVFYPAAPEWRQRLVDLGAVLCRALLDPRRIAG